MKKLLLFLSVCLYQVNFMTAQWIQTNGPDSQEVYAIAISGTNIFAGTFGAGVYLSTNNGTSWNASNIGLTDPFVRSLAIIGTNIFAGTSDNGMFLSTDNGTNWTQINNGLGNYLNRSSVVSGTNIFNGTLGGVYLSTDNGTNWTAVNNGLVNDDILAMAAIGTNIFAASADDVYLSTNNGTLWTPTGLTYSTYSLTVNGTDLYAGTWGTGVFLSTNNGANWNPVNTGLTNLYIWSMATSGSVILAGCYNNGVFVSTNNGVSWGSFNTGILDARVWSLAISGTTMFAGGDSTGSVWLRSLNDILDISENADNKFTLYPNPTSGEFTVITNVNNTINSIEIYNTHGEKIEMINSQQLMNGVVMVNISNQPCGIYFVKIINSIGEITMQKIIVE